jgi:hypothetical protein
MDVLIVGGAGAFGHFLQRDILPSVKTVLSDDRDTRREEHQSLLKRARHVIVATPLAATRNWPVNWSIVVAMFPSQRHSG